MAKYPTEAGDIDSTPSLFGRALSFFRSAIGRPEYLYHGSERVLEGDELIPNTPKRSVSNPDHKLTAVYASDLMEHAIAEGILSNRGVRSYRLVRNGRNAIGVIYDGWPDEKGTVQLHALPSKTFKRRSRQWLSFDPVAPVQTKELHVSDYKHLFREATEAENAEFSRKYGEI